MHRREGNLGCAPPQQAEGRRTGELPMFPRQPLPEQPHPAPRHPHMTRGGPGIGGAGYQRARVLCPPLPSRGRSPASSRGRGTPALAFPSARTPERPKPAFLPIPSPSRRRAQTPALTCTSRPGRRALHPSAASPRSSAGSRLRGAGAQGRWTPAAGSCGRKQSCLHD